MSKKDSFARATQFFILHCFEINNDKYTVAWNQLNFDIAQDWI